MKISISHLEAGDTFLSTLPTREDELFIVTGFKMRGQSVEYVIAELIMRREQGRWRSVARQEERWSAETIIIPAVIDIRPL